MNTFGKTVVAAALGSCVSLMVGCASSSLVDKWHDPSYKAQPLVKMLVIAARKDMAKRRIWEDAFAGELAKHGVAATMSYSLFRDAPPDTSQLIATVQTNGFDAILVVLRLPTEKITKYVQGDTSVEFDMRNGLHSLPYYTAGPYWQRYRTYFREIDIPGYVDTQTVAVRAIDVTTTGNNGRLIWSAMSRTPDPGSVMDVQRGIACLVISDLAKRRIISSEK